MHNYNPYNPRMNLLFLGLSILLGISLLSHLFTILIKSFGWENKLPKRILSIIKIFEYCMIIMIPAIFIILVYVYYYNNGNFIGSIDISSTCIMLILFIGGIIRLKFFLGKIEKQKIERTNHDWHYIIAFTILLYGFVYLIDLPLYIQTNTRDCTIRDEHIAKCGNDYCNDDCEPTLCTIPCESIEVGFFNLDAYKNKLPNQNRY